MRWSVSKSRKYNKLVRDRIPKIIMESGRKPVYHVADIPNFNLRLYDKMREELTEFMEYPCVEEAADMYEVFLTMLSNWEIDYEDVVATAHTKREERGGFRRGIILEEVISDE